MEKTLIILNPHAASGRAGQIWTQLEPLLWSKLGELLVAITQQPQDVAQHLDKAYASGITRVISIGGDGTNHALINALADLNDRYPDGPPMVYGNMPIGTGRDWARGIGIPVNNLEGAADWIASAQPRPTDIGMLRYPNGEREYFLNVASAGIGSEVAARVNKQATRKPWTFLAAAVGTLLQYQPRPMQILLDHKPWYEGRAYIVAVANGSTFGHGMKIAPNAQIRDGLFDVVLVEAMSRPRILAALPKVYQGTHLTHPKVRSQQASHIEIKSGTGKLGLELDGESVSGSEVSFEIRPGLLHLLS